MVNLTQKIKNLALQNNIPYQDCTAKLTEYFVFNNWFNDTPKVINKELYISDETWNNNENEIVSYFSSFNKHLTRNMKGLFRCLKRNSLRLLGISIDSKEMSLLTEALL